MNKRKIVNDPIYGLIHLPHELLFDIIEHPYFQRLRRIKQLGLTHLVYPGATHTRFEHVLGAMHLMTQALDTLRFKGIDISPDEALGATLAILLHDIGHGPYSHSMEHRFVAGFSHEEFTVLFLEKINAQSGGLLDTCLAIFKNQYPKKFLHQLVSSQLDMDRLDYLARDSFYTGVSEGVIGADRIIKMLQLHNDQLVVEAKGIYSIEKFLIARRLMYWQVYLHKTSLVAENMLQQVFARAQQLALAGQEVFASPALRFFLYNDLTRHNVYSTDPNVGRRNEIIDHFALLDDTDLFSALKAWISHPDFVLSTLARSLVYRQLFAVTIQEQPFDTDLHLSRCQLLARHYGISLHEAQYLVITGSVSNHAYSIKSDKINILFKDGSVKDISQASDMLNTEVLSKNVTKYFMCFPKELKALMS